MIRDKPWWPWLKRALTFAFFALVIGLLVKYARGVDWGDVKESLLALPRHVLWEAAALCACSHLLYSCFDLVGRRYTGHRLRVPQVMQVNFISYAFNLNMGSLVGGVAFRFRMYSRLGLATATITRVLTLSMLTNWLGYLLLAGIVFTVAPLALPPDWKLDSEGLQLLGIVLLALALTYLLLCGWSKKRSWTLRGHELLLPRPTMAIVQLAMSCANWMIMAGAVHVLLQGKVPYSDVLSVLLVAAVAGVITHVPAGLGVLEAVFVALLSHRVPDAQLLAALLGYRALYYIGPLLAAAVMYLSVELRARKQLPVPQRP
ncbi:lysylphosphatidylglycerol synthase domain-containing protein [Caenimonas sedimenti]|uniref:lysylphosphatidylglycerol synthase domain-containing protein n=1 Tax=Caenimonas sedimenti TaxID=2596921 RepID=UPI0032C48498